MPAVATPCVKICVVDPATRLCRGCGRTLAEIARWTSMSEAERRHVMAGLAERLRAAGLAAEARA